MKLTIEIHTGNAAFGRIEELPEAHLGDVLNNLILPARIEPGEDGRIFDTTGNRVGYWEWK